MSKLSLEFAELTTDMDHDADNALVDWVTLNCSAIWAALKEVERQRAERDKRIRDAAAGYMERRK